MALSPANPPARRPEVMIPWGHPSFTRAFVDVSPPCKAHHQPSVSIPMRSYHGRRDRPGDLRYVKSGTQDDDMQESHKHHSCPVFPDRVVRIKCATPVSSFGHTNGASRIALQASGQLTSVNHPVGQVGLAGGSGIPKRDPNVDLGLDGRFEVEIRMPITPLRVGHGSLGCETRRHVSRRGNTYVPIMLILTDGCGSPGASRTADQANDLLGSCKR
ncbi:uncharacterized protein B0H64DRAFT_119689 [Chaetomium fimeti]|uniref:Uncharacterized protein n=1 Tax=Chaetomium fimeti TaxID=1854472 RepID=A0AAE0HJ61_9PEZI|nr:hypothetical protein B0H64DRAFT_119689 [Chaetomium fimeti]